MGHRRILPLVLAVLVTLGLSAIVLGILRYGGPQGLILRVRAEFGLAPTREAFVPTPLPTPLAAAPTRQEPTASPSATPAAIAAAATVVAPTTVGQATTVDQATATLTAAPSATPTATALPSPTALPTASYLPAREAVALSGFVHEWQTWNNCGPATLAMYLSYYGSGLCQDDVRETIRPNWEDKHADVYEMAEFARAAGPQRPGAGQRRRRAAAPAAEQRRAGHGGHLAHRQQGRADGPLSPDHRL